MSKPIVESHVVTGEDMYQLAHGAFKWAESRGITNMAIVVGAMRTAADHLEKLAAKHGHTAHVVVDTLGEN